MVTTSTTKGRTRFCTLYSALVQRPIHARVVQWSSHQIDWQPQGNAARCIELKSFVVHLGREAREEIRPCVVHVALSLRTIIFDKPTIQQLASLYLVIQLLRWWSQEHFQLQLCTESTHCLPCGCHHCMGGYLSPESRIACLVLTRTIVRGPDALPLLNSSRAVLAACRRGRCHSSTRFLAMCGDLTLCRSGGGCFCPRHHAIHSTPLEGILGNCLLCRLLYVLPSGALQGSRLIMGAHRWGDSSVQIEGMPLPHPGDPVRPGHDREQSDAKLRLSR